MTATTVTRVPAPPHVPGYHLEAIGPGSYLAHPTAVARPIPRRTEPQVELTDRQVEVLQDAADHGGDIDDIARRLDIAPATVHAHLGRAYKRLGARSRAHALFLALRQGLIR